MTALALAQDPRLAPLLAEAVEGRAMQDLCLVSAERRLATDLRGAGIERWVLLKGSATAHLLYDQSSDRERTDVDVLISAADFGPAIDALLAAGWRDDTHPGLWAGAGGPQPWERTLVLEGAGAEAGADLHQRLIRWRQFTPDHEGVIARATVDASGLRLSHPEDLLLHGAVHAANVAFDVPLRSYVDVARLSRRPELDWDRLVSRAHEWRVQTALWGALGVARDWLGATPPESVMAALAPSAAVRAGLGRALAGEEDVPTSRHIRGRVAYVLIAALVRRGAAARASFAAEYARTRLSHALISGRARTPR